ncbi:Protein mono-ADP-ribosyltransferase PARP4 [Dissostichus eleginoides]|uniref:Protein mono-ADP-ribosyltransferase PARP4 n=1 Tax=Dissostichus eleginoides TaxID=100907 RepID=A0AAD9CMR5_DISEL|nr:Protein mono-ADP-ribosyltransferase PARP4 [Dissostichus eleginoides]
MGKHLKPGTPSGEHNPSLTLSSWLPAPPSRLFHPTQNNIVHLPPPPQAGTQAAMCLQTHTSLWVMEFSNESLVVNNAFRSSTGCRQIQVRKINGYEQPREARLSKHERPKFITPISPCPALPYHKREKKEWKYKNEKG